MILVNTTYHIHTSLVPTFEQWMHSQLIPAANRSGIVTEPQLMKILADVAPECSSYAMHVKAMNMDHAEKWEDMSAVIRAELSHTCGDKALWFTTYMEII